MSAIVTDSYSDIDLQDPAAYYGGFKEGRVIKWGDSDRALSDFTTGDWRGAQFTFTISDFDRKLRKQIVSAADRFWSYNIALTVYMTTRANRAALGLPYAVFVGPIIDAQPTRPLAWEITLSDIVGQGLLSDQVMLPWRLIGDGFIDQITPVTGLDPTTPEPIIYGSHRRIVDVDAPSPQGFAYTPIYLGIETITAQDWHVWMIAGHACADIPDVLVDGDTVVPDEGSEWLIPHHTGYDTLFGAPYQDRRSVSFGNDRRYTLLYGKVTDLEADPDSLTNPDACALGHKALTVFVDGIEATGDGSGVLITDRFLQYKHFVVNFIAHQGIDSYQSGAWLANPTWTLGDGSTVPVVETESFTNCKAIADARLPPDGYIGAAVIGARSGTRASARKWIADWNRSCGCQQGITHLGQFRICLLHPTEAIKAAAPLFTDSYEILDQSFGASLAYGDHANQIPFVADYHHETATWKTQDIATAEESYLAYGRAIVAEQREYPFAPGITMSWHLARLTVLTTKNPPISIVLEATVGHQSDGSSLGYLDLGDYIRYLHYAAPGERGEERIAQITRHQVLAGTRRVRIEARDCEDLIGYDTFVGGGVEAAVNNTCATAIEIDSDTWDLALDTTDAPTDDSVEGMFGGSGFAYHAAWFKYTAAVNGYYSFSTIGSDYDTQLAVFIGTCDELLFVGYNDNFAGAMTSALDGVAIFAGQTYYILVSGYGPDDGGFLSVHLRFPVPPL